MDAWFDCMSYLRARQGMTAITLRDDEMLALEIPNAEAFRRRFPELAADLWDCTAIVNSRYLDRGQQPAILLVPVHRASPRSAS
jgi:Barstar (barnase inhibitor)